jgi:threonine synthase
MGVGMFKGIPLQMVSATNEEILAAIKTYWSRDIPLVDPTNAFAMMGGNSSDQRDRSSK